MVTRGAFEKLYPETSISARWVVVIGNRRLAAAHKFGRPELDVVVKDELAKDRATLLTAVKISAYLRMSEPMPRLR